MATLTRKTNELVSVVRITLVLPAVDTNVVIQLLWERAKYVNG